MGNVYTRAVLHTPNPRVGLMSMGEEETKGTDLTKEVHEVLKASILNFVGNVEGHDIFSGKVDVVVMDGFTGNVALKASESLAAVPDAASSRRSCCATPVRKLGALLSRGAFRGGAPAHRCRGVRRRPAARGEGLLRDRSRPVERGRGQARDPGRGRVLLERREREDRVRAARARLPAGPCRARGGAGVSVAFVFPGQGSQKVGMGRALAEAFVESRAVFEEADQALGFALSKLCFEGPEGDLQLTTNTQPAILTASVAAWRALASRGVRPDWAAGHSLGEYSALVAADALSLKDAVATVRRRGAYMQEAVPVGEGAMAAILGLDLAAIEAACREAAAGEVVSPANVNSPGQVVIAGHAGAVDRAIEACKAAGAKRAIRLPVSAPFHCALMRPAQERLARDLARLAFRDPAFPLVDNVDARVVRGADECREGLVRQVSAPVRWQESVEALVPRGRHDLRGGGSGDGALRPGQEDREGSARHERRGSRAPSRQRRPLCAGTLA